MISVSRYFAMISFLIASRITRITRPPIARLPYLCRTVSNNYTNSCQGVKERSECIRPLLSLTPTPANLSFSRDTHCLNRRENEYLKSGNVTRWLVEGEAQWWCGKLWAVGGVRRCPDALKSRCLGWGFSLSISPSCKGPTGTPANVKNKGWGGWWGAVD